MISISKPPAYAGGFSRLNPSWVGLGKLKVSFDLAMPFGSKKVAGQAYSRQYSTSHQPSEVFSPLEGKHFEVPYREFNMFFLKTIFGKSKEEMADFLANHRRYSTMGTRSAAESYSNCCKIHSLGLRGAQLAKAQEVVQLENLQDLINRPIRRFTEETYGAYTVGFNGRMGGHMVLYSGEYYDPGYKSYCTGCEQRNYQAVPAGESAPCGVCTTPRTNYKVPPRFHRVHSNGIDHGMSRDDFLDLSQSQLKTKFDLVRRFDEVCDQVRDEFITLLDDFIVVEEQVMVPTMVKRLARI